MKIAVVPQAWLGLLNTWSAEPLLKLSQRVADAGIDPGDIAAVLAVAKSEDAKTEARLAAINAELAELNARVVTLRAEKAQLQPIIPRDGRFKRASG